MTDLKKLADEIVYGAAGFREPTFQSITLVNQILEALERVQKETLEARIVWPSGVYTPPKDQSSYECMEAVKTFHAWLRANIRIAPVEQVGDEELRTMARESCNHGVEGLPAYYDNDVNYWIAGYRAAEKKAREEFIKCPHCEGNRLTCKCEC